MIPNDGITRRKVYSRISDTNLDDLLVQLLAIKYESENFPVSNVNGFSRSSFLQKFPCNHNEALKSRSFGCEKSSIYKPLSNCSLEIRVLCSILF